MCVQARVTVKAFTSHATDDSFLLIYGTNPDMGFKRKAELNFVSGNTAYRMKINIIKHFGGNMEKVAKLQINQKLQKKRHSL